MNDLQKVRSLPLVTIVMAVYHPREDWLIEQLKSLNRQTYKNIELILCDDGPDFPVNEGVVHKYIDAFPLSLLYNQANMGSNKTFERLTLAANGIYTAYCDQDDIWEENKIELLVKKLEETGAELCCSDLSMIDEEGRFIAGSITKVRKRHIFKQGANLAPELIVKNFVTGCAMIIKTQTAKAAVPFEENMVHDHWLALFSALKGEITFEPTATVRYRQHGGNQTSVLAGIRTKDDYYRTRIELLYKRVSSLKQRLQADEKIAAVLDEVFFWALARKEFFKHPRLKTAGIMWASRRFDVYSIWFELLMPLIPKSFFRKVISLVK